MLELKFVTNMPSVLTSLHPLAADFTCLLCGELHNLVFNSGGNMWAALRLTRSSWRERTDAHAWWLNAKVILVLLCCVLGVVPSSTKTRNDCLNDVGTEVAASQLRFHKYSETYYFCKRVNMQKMQWTSVWNIEIVWWLWYFCHRICALIYLHVSLP